MDLDIGFGYEFVENNEFSFDEWIKYCKDIGEITVNLFIKHDMSVDKFDIDKLIRIQKIKLKAFCCKLQNHPLEGQLQVVSCVIYKLLNYVKGVKVDIKNVLIELFGNNVPCIIERWYPMHEHKIESLFQELIIKINLNR